MSNLELKGITEKHKKEVRRTLKNYGKYILFKINKAKSYQYFKQLKDNCSLAYFNKQMYQIRKFLIHLKIDWAKEIILPSAPVYYPKRISSAEIQTTLSHLNGKENYIQLRAITFLGASSGLRAEELFQLNPKDIDFENRTVFIQHNPHNGQSTKTKRSRVSFFNEDARNSLIIYLDFFNKNNGSKKLFPKRTLERAFKDAPIMVKDLRKFFSQEWDRRGGPTSIKKILMGHSLKGDVDLMHYNAQSPEDLKKIYDKVMSDPLV